MKTLPICRPARTGLLTLSLLFVLHLAAAADWKAGFAAAKITPDEPLLLAGYASRDKPADGVLDDLHAKAMALEDGDGKRAVVITADLIGFRADFAEPICERITAATGIPRERILLNASHIHSGPSVILNKEGHDGLGNGQADKLVAYTRKFQDQCVALAGAAIEQLKPARLSWGGGVVNFPMNRREFTARGVILGMNPRGPVDRTVPVLRIETPEGKLMGVLFGTACHNTTFGSKDNQVSGDFAGYAQAHVEKAFPGVQAMFVIGLAGDANPYPNSTNDPAKRPSVEIARQHGAELGREVARVLGTTLKPVNGPLRTAYATAELPLQPPPSKAELETTAAKAGSWQKWVAMRMLAVQSLDGKILTHFTAPIAVWQFGQDLTWVGLSGEVVVDYAALLERTLGPLNLWLSSYCNDAFGYMPSARVLREGGYETRGLFSPGFGYFAPEAEKVLVEKVAELATKVGRPR
ncbi:MAG: neutral/alkaline non-lysosomal ceramidase N-terminal domain-containing protein [Chthoniobacteraceae bacterium]